MSHYLEAAATLDRQRAADLKATDAELSESQKRYIATLERHNRAAGACSQCQQVVRTEGHAADYQWGAAC